MKDKRTKHEIAANRRFLKALAENGAVLCRSNFKIVGPSNDWSKEEKCWTLLIQQKNFEGKTIASVVVGWYKTRDIARSHAKLLRRVLGG